MEDFCLDFFKYQENKEGFYAPRHYHGCFELVYYCTGNGKFTLNDQEYNYSPHTFALIPPHVIHDESAFKDSSLLFIGFRYFDSECLLEPGVYNDFNDLCVYHALKDMFDEMNRKEPFYISRLNAMTQILIISIVRQYFAVNSNSHDEGMEYIQKYLNEHFNEKIQLYELAEMSGYSYDWFRHVFKRQTGMSVTQYIILQRLKHAANQLITTNKTVTQIALENNFSSSSQFISQFRKHNGITPKAYRKIYQNKTFVQLENE